MDSRVTSFLESEGCYLRSQPSLVDEAVARLGVTPPQIFLDFYRKYEGTFCSAYTSFELADLVGHVEDLTKTGRDVHHFEKRYVVLSDEVADSVLVYDTIKDLVFDVDFEGSDEKLRQGILEPRWSGFEKFLNFYFLGIESPG